MSRSLPLTLALLAVAASPLLATASPSASASASAENSGTNRIIGGRPSPTPYPFMISYGQGDTFHECGAALIAPGWAVTAHHCVSGDFWSNHMWARIGSLDYTTGEKIKLNKAIKHPNVNGVFIDIALIPLATPSKMTPIPIADSAPAGTRTRILGWGRTTNAADSTAPRQLQELDTSILDESRCSTITPKLITGKELCTENPGGVTGACKGDSGGPQMSWVNGQWQLVGVTSRGPEKCGSEPAVYTDVTAYKDWIAKVMAGQKP